jgi:hypothetical protein
VGSLLTFNIPQTALVATLDTYDFIIFSNAKPKNRGAAVSHVLKTGAACAPSIY